MAASQGDGQIQIGRLLPQPRLYVRRHDSPSHSQIVGFKDYDYHEDIKPFHFVGPTIFEEDGLTITLSKRPIIGFYEVNLILKDRAKLEKFVRCMQTTAHYFMHSFIRFNDSYNIFFYDFPDDDALYVKIIPRFLTNPLFVGYMIPQIANGGHSAHFIQELQTRCMTYRKDGPYTFMRLFAIGDLHLSGNPPKKPMEVFGPRWKNHWQRIAEDWKERVTDDDTVLIAGDTSWAMRLDEAQEDLDQIRAAGQKNHYPRQPRLLVGQCRKTEPHGCRK